MSDELIGSGGEPEIGTGPAGDTGVAEVSIPEVDDNFQFRLPGQTKPIKLSDYRAGFQSQATKASQEAARLRQEMAQIKQQQAMEQQRLQAEQRRAAGQGQGQGDNWLAQLRQLTYLDGEQAAGLAERMAGQMQQRDQILVASLQELKRLRDVVATLHDTHQGSAFDGKINRWIQEGGYPDDPAVRDLAKEIFLAYEGDDLETEFPQIFKNRWDSIQRVIEASRAAKVNAARKPAFVPGRGGLGGPSKPLQLDPRANAADTASALWESLQTNGT